jgi:hypothetical protein
MATTTATTIGITATTTTIITTATAGTVRIIFYIVGTASTICIATLSIDNWVDVHVHINVLSQQQRAGL